MKFFLKFFVSIIFLITIDLNGTFISNKLSYSYSNPYQVANNWYNEHTKNLSREIKEILIDYIFSRVQEIDFWIKREKNNLLGIEYDIINEGYKNSIKQKINLTLKLVKTNAYLALQAARNEGNKIASKKLATEILTSIFLEYKSGKKIAAKLLKRNFFFECYKLLKSS